MKYIEKNTSYNEIKIKEIEYGLNSLYITISKAIIILPIAFILNIFKEVLIYLIIFNILRLYSFGLHATKSWICLLSSALLFIGIPLMCTYLQIPLAIKLIICILGILFMFKNSPADTYKRPIVSKKRRNKFKFLSTTLTIIYSFIIIFIKNNFISNCLLFSIIMQNCMISPIVYKIFKLPYNNYLNYIKNHPDISFN